jgi:excisionase family DNA binding protein
MKTEILQKLDEIKELFKAQRIKPFTFNEAAEYLDISKSYLYKLTSQGKIPHYKPYGKKIYFDKVTLDQWVFSKPVKGTADIEAEAIKYLSK